ncbi:MULTISPECIES: hypothetical protein [unclassified Lacrimispora]
MKIMVEGRTKDNLVSVTSYEYGLNNRLEKETRGKRICIAGMEAIS